MYGWYISLFVFFVKSSPPFDKRGVALWFHNKQTLYIVQIRIGLCTLLLYSVALQVEINVHVIDFAE